MLTTLAVTLLAGATALHTPARPLGRRAVIGTAAALSLLPVTAAFAADTEASIIAEIKEIRAKLDVPTINKLLETEQWDAVRSIFKAAPVNLAWEQTLAKKNPFKKLADLRDDVEQFEVVDELASAIQLADQYCYSNTFIYTQPGNGKVKIKEPKQQVAIAVQKIEGFLQPQ